MIYSVFWLELLLIVSRYLDYINLMTYDLHGSWDPITGLNSPLYSANPNALSVDSCVNAWLKAGARPEKLIVGIPLYGRTFTLSNTKKNGIGAAASGAGKQGEYSREPGYLSFLEV